MNKSLALRLAAHHIAGNYTLRKTAASLARTSRNLRNATKPGLRRAFWSKKATEFLFRILRSRTPVDVHAVEAALASGADPNAEEDDGWTPLMYAAAKGHDTIVQRLIVAGASANAKSNSGWTPLMSAAENG